jgi:lipoprotein-releasing system permease protein
MNVSLYIAKRYLFTKSSNNAINIISKIAAVGVIFGSLLLLVVLAGFSGLKTFSISYTSVVDPDFKVFPISGKRLLLTEQQLQQLTNNSNIISFSKVVEEKVFLEFKKKNELAVLKGVDENYQNTVIIDTTLVAGKWFEPKSNQTVAGFLLADKLNLGVFDYTSNLNMYVPKPGKGQLNQKAFDKIIGQNVGLFDVNEEVNQKYIYTSLEATQDLLNYPTNEISYIELKAIENVDENLLRTELTTIFNNTILIKNRIQLNDALHKMLNTENIVVYLIFTLILIIALFNVIGSIIMMIIDKKHDLKTLYNLGTPIREIKKIFFYQGALLTFLGGICGVVLGLLLVGSQLLFNYIKIPGTTIPYPVELTLSNIIIVLVTIFGLGLLASKIASYRISRKLIGA